MADLPPPLPITNDSARSKFAFRALLTLATLFVLGVGTLFALRAGGAYRVFSTPANSMAPAVIKGDHVIMRGRITPHRGDIIVFDTSEIRGLGGTHEFYLKRLVGLPGENLRIADGKLYVNGQVTPLRNKEGEIQYQNSPMAAYLNTAEATVIVPEDAYFVLGDNSPNSADSRYWGFVPKHSVIGRIFYCYTPAERRGPVE